MQSRRRPLFPIEPIDDAATSATTKLRYVLRILQVNWKIYATAFALALLAVLWYYPAFFFVFLFVGYSLLLALAAVVATIYIHYIFTTNEPIKPNREPSNVLYNATKSSIFDLPNPIKNPSNLPLIFGKTVDLQLQQIIEYVLRDFMLPWLG
ncbi:uncharacterized protein LOC119666886 [Teleopsis dalmanni]|nr:uncharacterized protein LOC119666886 [Teleopsis dalmanni]